MESVSKERNPLVPPELDTHKQPRLHTRLQAPLPPMVLQHTRALGIPSHVRYISYFEGLLRSSGDQWKCNTAQLSRVRVVGGVPNLHQSLLQKGCKLHAVVQVAQYQLPLEAYMALGSDKASPMSKRVGGREREKAQQGKEAAAEALFAELTGSEPAVLHTVFDQLQVAYGGDKQRLPFYSQSDATASTTPSRRPGGPDSPGAAAVAGKSAGIDLDLSAYDVRVRGDCILHLYSEDVRVMSIAFHTAFVAGSGYLQFDAAVVDLACEDRQHKAFPAATKVELFLTPVDDSILLNVQNVDAMLR